MLKYKGTKVRIFYIKNSLNKHGQLNFLLYGTEKCTTLLNITKNKELFAPEIQFLVYT